MKTEQIKLNSVKENPDNPRQIKNQNFERLVTSLLAFPKMLSLRPIVVDDDLVILGGNMRMRALKEIKKMTAADIAERLAKSVAFGKKAANEQIAIADHWEKWKSSPMVEVIRASELSEAEQKEFIIKDNAAFGEWDMDCLANGWDMQELEEYGVDLFNDGEWGEEHEETDGNGTQAKLTDRFIEPPFSVLDTRSGRWQERKRKWVEVLGDEGGATREGVLSTSLTNLYADLYKKYDRLKEKNVSFAEYVEKHKGEAKPLRSVSLFDPVLSEILCAWFTPHAGSKIFDPFAGDTRKGLVFAHCGHTFKGIELRQEQVEENRRIIADSGLSVEYVCDDGQNVSSHFEKESQDLLFSCPPYFDLEVYSDLPNDASNQKSYGDFIRILRNAFGAAYDCLKNNRFAVIVASDVRGKDGGYYDFCGDIKRMFREFGAAYVNEIIIVNNAAGVVLGTQNAMKGRKVTRCHQVAMCFFKGDPRSVRKEFPPIEMAGVDDVIKKEWTDRVDGIESV